MQHLGCARSSCRLIGRAGGTGSVVALTARSALVSLPVELLDDAEPSDDTVELMTDRLRLTRVLVDMAQSLE